MYTAFADSPTRILTARWLLTMADGDPVRDGHALVLAESRIHSVLPLDEARRKWPELPVEDFGDQVLMPGLVNGHGHGAMTLMRGFADDLPLETWLQERIWPLEARWVGTEWVADGVELAAAEMIASGTTTFSDMYFFPEAGAAVAHRTGLRAQICMPLIRFPTAWASGTDEGIHKGLALHDEYRALDRIRVAFGPHSTYTMDFAALERIATLAETADLAVQIHLHETADEVETARRETGERPLDTVIRAGLFGPRLQAVHMAHLADADIERLAEHDAAVIHCPQSNLKLASGLCRVRDLRRAGVRVGLGTDGAASNNGLSMFREMHVAAILAKVVAGDAAALPAMEVLRMATLGGAEALGMGEITGSLEPGKAADLIVVDLSGAATTPVFHAESQLVYTGTAARVTEVRVDGVPLYSGGEHLRLDEAAVIDRANRWRDRMQSSPPLRAGSGGAA
jgi:5-methylthioadenosine/S-adenosylhomocysteine deaminase